MTSITITTDYDTLHARILAFGAAASCIIDLSLDDEDTNETLDDIATNLINALITETNDELHCATLENEVEGYIIVGKDSRARQTNYVYTHKDDAEQYLKSLGRTILRTQYEIIPLRRVNP